MSRISNIELYGTHRLPVRKKECLILGTEEEYVTSNSMGRAVCQFEKEDSFRLGTREEYVTSNCMGPAVRQFEKEVSFRRGTRENMLHRTV